MGRPRISADRLTNAFCVGGYIADNNNIGNRRTDQYDGAICIVVSAHDRNEFAAAISLKCGDDGHEWPITI
jgi:hypothetical protein